MHTRLSVLCRTVLAELTGDAGGDAGADAVLDDLHWLVSLTGALVSWATVAAVLAAVLTVERCRRWAEHRTNADVVLVLEWGVGLVLSLQGRPDPLAVLRRGWVTLAGSVSRTRLVLGTAALSGLAAVMVAWDVVR